MTTITIPKEFTQKDDLVVIPRKQYETLLEIADNRALDTDIQKSLKNYKEGKYSGPFSSVAEMRKSLKKKR